MDDMDKQDSEEKTGSLVEEKTRLAKLQADKLTLELATLKGQLLLFEDVEREWSDIAHAFKVKMMAIPSKIAPTLANSSDVHEIQDILTREVREALDELSRFDADKFSRKQERALRKGAKSR